MRHHALQVMAALHRLLQRLLRVTIASRLDLSTCLARDELGKSGFALESAAWNTLRMIRRRSLIGACLDLTIELTACTYFGFDGKSFRDLLHAH
jgi:hypothetical protein